MEAARPPTGPVPDRGVPLIIMMWVLTIIASTTVILRFAFQLKKSRIGWGDWCSFISAVFFYGYTIDLTIYCLKGGEKHSVDLVDLSPETRSQITLLNWTSQILIVFGLQAGKISISALLLAVLKSTDKKWQKIYLWVVCIGIESLLCMSIAVFTLAQCSPPKALWDHRVLGKCVRPMIEADYAVFFCSYNVLVDVSLAIIPATIFFTLQMSMQEKITLSVVFGLNILTSICAAVKVYYVPQLGQRNDFTWGTFEIFAWATVEFFFMVICGTAPTMKPLLDFAQHQIGACPWSSNNANTAQSAEPSDGLELNGYRRDVSRAHTVISNSPRKTSAKSADADTGDQFTVGKTYQVRVEREDGHNSSFVEVSRGLERRISTQTLGVEAIKCTPEIQK